MELLADAVRAPGSADSSPAPGPRPLVQRLAPLLRAPEGVGAIVGEADPERLRDLAAVGLDLGEWPRLGWSELAAYRGLGEPTARLVAFLDPAADAVTPAQARALTGCLAIGGAAALVSTRPLTESAARDEIAVWLEAGCLPLAPRDSAESRAELRLVRHERFAVRVYAAGDEGAILDLFRRCFHVDRGLDRWRWLYRENPWGGPNISLAVDADGAPVAHYAGYPVRFARALAGESRSVLGQQVGDTMTAPEVRGVGRGPTSLLGRTAQHFYASFCDGRIDFNYGFNTGNIQRFSMLFVGAQVVEPVHYRHLEGAALERWRGPAGGFARRFGYRVERLDRIDRVGPELDRLFARARDAYRFLVQRDARYLAWRYLACPDVDYAVFAARRFGRLVGWAVFRRRGERLLWGDALALPSASGAPEHLLRAALASELAAGATRVEGWFPNRPAFWDRTLRGLGFADAPEPQALSMVFVPFRDPDPGPALRGELYYTWGDSDLF